MMQREAVMVQATWTPDGWPIPAQIVWRGAPLAVQDVGRRWKADDGLHLLARVAGGRVFELHTNGAHWWARIVSAPPGRA
ncbi:MAG: hypothetical protein GX613_03580 [Chloroflexi bacterium]|nr:hypothetical protein [Chloroflexota bacterium]